MSVFISGVSLPKDKEALLIYSDGTICLRKPFGLCQETYEAVEGNAVEIKSPHGRLIDADTLCRIDGKDEEGFYCQIVYDWDIEEAPTIIEAEGGGEDG